MDGDYQSAILREHRTELIIASLLTVNISSPMDDVICVR